MSGGNRARIAVLVSGGGTNLQALIDAEQSGILHSGTIALVLSSNPAAYALTRAEKAGIPAAVVTKTDCGSQAGFERTLNEHLRRYAIDMIVLAGFMTILSGDFTDLWQNKIINVHPSLIPAFCGKGMYGLRVHAAALSYGVKVTGATVHYVNAVPDGGRILLQKAVEIQEGDTPETLQKRVMEQAEWVILPQAAEMVSARIVKEKQEKA